MRSILLLAATIAILYIVTSSVVATSTSTSSEFDDYNDDYEESSTTTNKSSSKTSSSEYYEEEESNSSNNNEYEDEESEYEEEEDSSVSTSSHKQPYNCPSQCKCRFKRRSGQSSEYDDEEDYDYEKESVKLKRVKRDAVKNKTSDEYLYDYEDHSTSKKSRTHHVKYDITVDCSAQGLFTIADLFDYDFPLDQIVSFNLSSNKFRLLRLDDGFEDLLNLKELDISSNPYLKSISPRNFLKKFRFLEKIHLNNLPQINCQENEKTGRIVSIDCKWYRTLLYLHKRNISIDFNYFNRYSHQSGSINDQSTPKCTLGSLINNQANNIALISRCLTDFDSSDRPSSGSTRVKGTSNQTKIYNIDNVQYEFRIEPDLSQLLIEGDSLELTCRLTKKSSSAKKQPPFNSQIKWYLNEKQQLMISSIFYNNENPTQIEIFESKLKRQQHTPPRTNTEETVIESKLLITNTMSSQHTGKYSCSAIIEDSSGVKRTPISTSRVDIKVLGRQQLDANGVASNQAQVTKTMSTKMPTTTPMAYCDEMIVQTYRGVYKWPRTLANSKLSQKCVFTAAVANGGPNKANETSSVVAIECLADGRWSDQIDTRNCMFESNLTRYLARFAENKDEVISRPDLDEFIHKIVSIQSEPKSRLGGGIASSNPIPVQITTYDIIYIESFLLTALQHQKLASTDQSKSSWRHKFTWLSDMLGRLNEFYIRRAQSIHPHTFSSFFFEALLPVALTNTNNDLSTTLASSRLSRLTNTACCVLRRVQLTQQLEFICNAACRPIIDPSNNLPKLTQVQAVFSQHNSSLEFVVFENDRLIPVNLNLSTRNYDILTFAKPSTTTALNGHRVNRTCSQIVALRGRSVERVDLTIEIDLPRAYSRLLKLIYTQLANVSAANSERSSVDRNLFEYIFQSDRADFIRDESDVDEDDLPVMIISNGEWSTIAGSIEVDSNGAERGAAAVRRDERLVKSELRMARFRDELVNKWLNPLSYEVVYGLEKNFTRSDDSNRTYRLIDWATSMDGFRCTLINVHINWQPNSSIQFTDLFRTYAVLSCNQTSTNQSSDKLTMIGVRHRSEINTTSSKSNLKNVAIAQLFEKYSSAFKLDLDSSANNLGPIDRFLHSMRLKYRLFEHRLVYVASALVSILLVANILLYSTLHASLQMPRSFYHVFVNKWLAIAGLNAIYAIGSTQIHLPHLCFFTAAASHYLLLASFAWYAIYFYVLYKKLAVLKRRNAVLIFNPELANKIDREPEDEDDDECHGLDGKNQGFIKRPVIHLYMIAWGLPLALCSIIISITRQDYIQTPYSYCFTNEPNILVGSVMLPIVFVFAAQFVIVMLILRTLRRIMIDLKHDELINGPQDDADDYEDEVKVSPGLATDRVDDRQELCKNWLNSKTAKDQQGTYNGTRVGSHADNLAATDMIEIKMNPITQKSLVINHSAYTTALGGAAEDSSTSFERESSLDSDGTSVMDTQYKPHVQLKFAFISWLVYFVLCALAASLTLVSTSPSPDPFLLRLFSFFFVVFASAYAIMQFVFYSLSRDDVCGQFGICSVSLFGGKKVEMADNVDEYDDTKKCPDEVDNRADYETKSDVIEGVEKWSYEPKVIVPTPTLRENTAPVSLLPNVVANNPSSPPKITLDDCIYEKYQFRSIAEKDKTQTETLIVTTTTLATSTSATREGGFESLSMSKKVSRGLEEDTSAEEEIISDDDDHKKSISDVLFSAAKKTSPTTTVSQKTKHDSPKQALNYKESPSNHPTSERNEMSTSSPLITSSGVEIDEEDVTESDETSTHSYADSNVNHVILNAPYQLEQQQHHKIVNHCPTLAVQEDMSDYITLTPQPAEQQHHQSIAKTPASLSVPKRSNHVRNPSLLSGATAQTIQLITGSNFTNDSETRDKKQQQPQSQPQQPSKRPLYVYVDHSYEEKLQTETTTTSTATTRKESNSIEPRSKRTNSRKNLLNDLLTNTCTSHIGNAIDSIVTAASSSTSSTSSQHNHQTTKLVQSKSMTIGTSNSSATTTRTSSMVSSSSTNEHLDVDEETQPMQQLPPQPKYRQSSVARLVANNAAHTTKTLPHSHVTARLDSTAAARLSASLLDAPPTNTTTTNAKNNLIQRPPRLRDFEPKHETSV